MPTINVNGIDLYYELHGDGEPLMLVHGLGTGAKDWGRQIPELKKHYCVIAPSLRGMGGSQPSPEPITLEHYAADLRALLDTLSIERCHLVGLSMGGAVAFQFAVDYPQRLNSLVIINSQPSFEINTFKKRVLWFSRLWIARLFGLQRLADYQARQNFPGTENAALRASLRGRFDNDLSTYLEAMAALGGWTVVERLERIRVPVLLLTSEFDYTSPREKARFADKLADATVQVIPGARHAVHIERPDEVTTAVLKFLERVTARDR